MKKRILKKKYNREVREFKLLMKRDKHYSINNEFVSYEYYEGEFFWSDIYFIGTYNGYKRLFNCTISSSLYDFEDKLDNIVDVELDDLYVDRHDNIHIDFGLPLEDGSRKASLITKNEKLESEIEAKRKELQESLIEDLSVTPYIKAVPNYQYGVGLDIVSSEKILTKDVVLKYVRLAKDMNIIRYEQVFLSDEKIKYNKEDLDLNESSRLLNC